ncbi:hypothetical protein IQE94_06425 [Synechocystis sp. PCC 7339]|uniref:hypothetical protein n=1 Tax=unclassified Synechocystis TaxID=2640012 RepID=UPI001BB065F0|nr:MULTISPECIES: hypothetical protein [unclassified Synechocystis]QUS61700.1 hypothetical protein HTZ78_14210 [Synechocystis sp. PCC 7338]UAJ73897.1 hypothetical protein IQE94_06425 [Synechocystis sp. PCC 7339]
MSTDRAGILLFGEFLLMFVTHFTTLSWNPPYWHHSLNSGFRQSTIFNLPQKPNGDRLG